jgi:uncharacterized protein (DUF2344 family)
MAHYFSYLPETQYKINGIYCCRRQETVTDITKRFKIAQLLNGREAFYYDYNVQDGDRPDSIAQKLYGDARLDWVVLLVNEIHDRYYEFPLSQNEFEEYIKVQYGSLSEAQSLVHHYEKIIQAQRTNSDGTITSERTVIVDETTYNSLPIDERRIVTAYQEEERRNESRRSIKLIDPQFIPQLLRLAGRAYQ